MQAGTRADLSVTNSPFHSNRAPPSAALYDGWCLRSCSGRALLNGDIGLRPALALSEAGWRTAQAMAESTWEEAHRV